jgi:radical SAM superfamily enzyme YgiQ (UPF0313 family)
MRITLVNPGFGQIFKLPPLGLLYIASVLREAGHEVNLVDTVFINTWQQFESSLALTNPEVVGITCMTPTVNSALRIAELAKSKYSCPVILGGPHATIMPESVLTDANVDYVIEGEGEITICELTDALQEGRDISQVAGVFYKEGNTIKRATPREPIGNLDDIPLPARDLAPNNYFKYGRGTMIASRGCPFNCSFCQPTLRKLFGTKLRLRSPENVVSEMEHLQKSLRIKFIKFDDDTLTVNKKWVYGLCNEIENRKMGVKWACNARVDTIDKEMLRVMKKSGCMKINFGVESGSQQILDILNKGITLEQTREAFDLCKQIGLRTHAYLMIGSPGETRETIHATADFIREIKPDDMYISITTPLPMTKLYEDLSRENAILAKDWADYDYSTNYTIRIEGLTNAEITRERRMISMNFWLRKLMNPRYLVRSLRDYPSPRLLLEMARGLLSQKG